MIYFKGLKKKQKYVPTRLEMCQWFMEYLKDRKECEVEVPKEVTEYVKKHLEMEKAFAKG